ncbi:hypothetical protein CI109_103360 [Kwoniella shandongensis]|uniref:Uncharacterized protein n=1 Tax=Kwoniella shandongensis TaxID=1734106 RepID=A0AAJ8LJD7_9TREE
MQKSLSPNEKKDNTHGVSTTTEVLQMDKADDGHTTNGEAWLYSWYYLRLRSGIIHPDQYHPPSCSSNASDPKQSIEGKRTDAKRKVPIHSYSLDSVRRTIHRSIFHTVPPPEELSETGWDTRTREHEEEMMLAWSIPKWTGWGPWSVHRSEETDGTQAQVGESATRKVILKPGCWMGTFEQRERWEEGETHYTEDELVSPSTIGLPSSSYERPIPTRTQAVQNSPLLNLPPSILTGISLHLIDIPSVARTNDNDISADQLSQSQIRSLTALLLTSKQLYEIYLPSSIWKYMTLSSISHLKYNLLIRWQSTPGGVRDELADQLALVLDEEFAIPVQEALQRAESQSSLDQNVPAALNFSDKKWTTRDVWIWWNSHKGWRSRRRVWECVVNACATARDADWW